MKWKQWIAFGLMLTFLWTEIGGMALAGEPDPGDLYAKSAVLMDGHSGRVLYEKNGQERLPMASTTKIMTCILALELGDPDQWLPVSSYASSMPQVRMGVHRGEEYRLEDLLYGLMLESYNDVAMVIAEGIAGSQEAFADLMNQKARDIGAYDTFFVTPNGLDATALCRGESGGQQERSHSTTAADLARILRYCISQSPKKEQFLAITQRESHQLWERQGQRSFICSNHNTYLHMMKGAITGKTGYTGQAGYCYVGAVEQGEELYIVALLACGWPNHKSYKWSDMTKLVKYGLEEYEYREVGQEIAPIPIPVIDGVDPMVTAEIKEVPSVRMLLGTWEEIQIQIDVVDALQAPVDAGTTVGCVNYLLNGEMVASYPLQTIRAVARKDFWWYLDQICQDFFLGTKGINESPSAGY